MAEPFVGEIRIFSFATIPQGWIPCNGQLLPVQSNQALFSLLYTTYGGDGRTTFGIPDLRGRVPVHPGAGVTVGQSAGEAAHVLIVNETPQHNHQLSASNVAGTAKVAANNVMATTGSIQSYTTTTTANAVMATTAISTVGQNAAHNNMQPYLTLSYCIATTGIYPPRPF